MNDQHLSDWEPDNVTYYKSLVALAKNVCHARVKKGSYGNKRIQFADCETWLTDKCKEINLWTYRQGHGLADFSDWT